MTFLLTDAPLQTDAMFAQQTDEEHRKGDMPLKALPLGLVLTMCIWP
jgi:hypothetical protein